MRITSPLRAAALVAATGLLALPTAGPAFASSGTYNIPLHQEKDLPITASGYGNKEAECAGVGPTQDGWHFVLPGNSTDFVKLTVKFEPGGEKVVTTFGPPANKHAYVASAAGAKLVSASATVKGGQVSWFNLSHTCPATSKPSPSPSPSPSNSPKPSPSPSGSTSPSPSPSGSTSASPSPSTSVSPSGSASPSVSPSGSGTPSAGSSSPAVVAPGASATPGAPGDSLAFTGTTGLLTTATIGTVLVAGGAALVISRRRKAAHRA